MRMGTKAAVVIGSIVLSLSAVAVAAEKPTAREQFAGIRRQATQAYRAKDYRAARTAYEQWHEFAPYSSAPIYNLACVNALLGGKKEALRWLALYARMGQVADLAKDPDLASLADDAEFKRLADQTTSHASVAARTEDWFSFSSAHLVHDAGDDGDRLRDEALVEDVAYDPASHTFYLASLTDKHVLKIAKDKKLTNPVNLSSDPGWPVFAVAVQGNALWVATAAMPDFAASPKADWGKSLLLKVDAKNGKILERYPTANDGRPHVLGDMALAADGTVAVSDGRSGDVYLLKPDANELQRIDAGEFISPQSPAFTPDGKYLFVADYARGVARIHLASGTVEWLKAFESAALAGIDGLYFDHGTLIAVQNGTSPARLARLTLSPDLAQITSLTTLAEGPDAQDINHGVLVEGDFYYIAQAGWDALDEHGDRKPDAKPVAPLLRRLRLQSVPGARK